MTFFEFVSVVQRHFKNCEIKSVRYEDERQTVEIKPEFIERFNQVALIGNCNVRTFSFCLRWVRNFTLDGVLFACEAE